MVMDNNSRIEKVLALEILDRYFTILRLPKAIIELATKSRNKLIGRNRSIQNSLPTVRTNEYSIGHPIDMLLRNSVPLIIVTVVEHDKQSNAVRTNMPK
jgi:hypothetical protein